MGLDLWVGHLCVGLDLWVGHLCMQCGLRSMGGSPLYAVWLLLLFLMCVRAVCMKMVPTLCLFKKVCYKIISLIDVHVCVGVHVWGGVHVWMQLWIKKKS